MSPSAALASPVYLFYLAVAGGLLLGAGILLAVLRWGLRKDVEHAWKAYGGWLVMVPLVFGVIFLGRETTIVFFTIIAAILVIPIVRNRVQGQLQVLALSIVGFVYFGWMFGFLGFLANAEHAYSYLLYLLFAVELNDVAAFTCGKLFGRHPLRSNISPKKTWEGSVGALVVSLILPWALSSTFPHFQARDLILIGLIVGVGGQLGDLAISVIKRDLGIKDMGATIPGHGGILDRIDSLIYVAPLFFHVVRFFHDLY